jgi:hypothetical protein
MENNIDQLKAYAEACSTLRHYSNASLTVRLASVVQGITILGAWAIALTQRIPSLMIALSSGGLLFTFLLYRFHVGYFRATVVFYEVAEKMEEKFFDEDCRPIATYNMMHKVLYSSRWSKAFTLNAPFALTGTLFVLALIITILVLLKVL